MRTKVKPQQEVQLWKKKLKRCMQEAAIWLLVLIAWFVRAAGALGARRRRLRSAGSERISDGRPAVLWPATRGLLRHRWDVDAPRALRCGELPSRWCVRRSNAACCASAILHDCWACLFSSKTRFLIELRPINAAGRRLCTDPDDVRMCLGNVMCLEATLNCYTFKQSIQSRSHSKIAIHWQQIGLVRARWWDETVLSLLVTPTTKLARSIPARIRRHQRMKTKMKS